MESCKETHKTKNPKEIWNPHMDQLSKEEKMSEEKSEFEAKEVLFKKEDVTIDGGNSGKEDNNHV